jgi:hypothetical protein
MANVKEHAWLGSGAGVVTYLCMCRYYNRPLDGGRAHGG